MSYGQAFAIILSTATAAVALMVAARARWQAPGLLITAAILCALLGGIFAVRGLSHGVRGSRLLAYLAPFIGAIVVGAAVVHLRRRSTRLVLTGAIAWMCILFTYFEVSYLLRR